MPRRRIEAARKEVESATDTHLAELLERWSPGQAEREAAQGEFERRQVRNQRYTTRAVVVVLFAFLVLVALLVAYGLQR